MCIYDLLWAKIPSWTCVFLKKKKKNDELHNGFSPFWRSEKSNLHMLKIAYRKIYTNILKEKNAIRSWSGYMFYSTVILVLLLHMFGPWETSYYNNSSLVFCTKKGLLFPESVVSLFFSGLQTST